MFVVQYLHFSGHLVRRPSLCNDSCRVVQTSGNCEGPAVKVHLNVVDVPVVQVVIWVRPFLDKVVDMPVVCNDRGFANSEGASDSVHRQSLWTFQLATETGTLSAGRVFWASFLAIFRAPPGCLELSACFRSPRWRRVLCHRGLLHIFILRTCRHRHFA